MAKKSSTLVGITEDIVSTELGDVVNGRFLKYAFKSLEDRALPDARDGLKPSQRRILVAMNDLNLSPTSSFKKCAKVSGDTSGNYHPHGEAVIYPTLVRLVQDWVLRGPLALGQGNFGNNDGDDAAAMRYTEVKLSRFGMALLEDLSPDVVPYIPTYNEEMMEPTVLPGKLPNLLLNGCAGIAVGWATDMPPHNLREIVKCIEAYIKNPNIKPADLIKLMPGPDFPTGGRLLGQDGVLSYYATGRGSLLVEGVYTIKKDAKGRESIVITALPYNVGPADFAADIEALAGDPKNKMDDIDDFKDLSKDEVNIIVGISKGANAQLVLSKLLKQTCLRKNIKVNQTVLLNGKVVDNIGLVALIEAFVSHRKIVLTNKYKAELKATEARVHILEGLISAANRIDEAIKLIRASENQEEAAVSLISKGIVQTDIQAKAVLAITLARLTKLESKALLEEKEKKEERIVWLKKILSNISEIEKLIIEEQRELASKLGDDRRTEIVHSFGDIVDEDLVKDEQVIISLTGDGYVKSTPASTYRQQNRGGKGSMSVSKKTDPEAIFEMFESNSKDLVLFFTSFGKVFQRKAYEIPQASKTGKGHHVSNMLKLDETEEVTNIISLKTVDREGYLTIVTRNGLIKRSEIREYDSGYKNAGIRAIKLDDDDRVAYAMFSEGDRFIVIVTAQGNCVRYSESILNIQGRATRGCKALKLEPGDSVVQVFALSPKDQPDILVITEGGFGKKTAFSEYREVMGRNAKGSAVIKKSSLAKNGYVAGACAITADDSLLVLTSKGKSIRVGSEDIRESGRATSGVRIVRLDDGDKVVKIAKLSKDSAGEEEGDESGSEILDAATV